MGWKCPECGIHNYKSGKCKGCHPNHCAICSTYKSVSNIHHHHVSYKADVTIPVCDDCHRKIHRKSGWHDELLPDLDRPEAERKGLIT